MAQRQQEEQQQHIRPRVRTRPSAKQVINAADADLDAMLDSTRSSVDRWLSGPTKMRVPHGMCQQDVSDVSAKLEELARQEQEQYERKQKAESVEPKGILRNAKYSRVLTSNSKQVQIPTKLLSDLTIQDDNTRVCDKEEMVHMMTSENPDESLEEVKEEQPKIAVKNLVLEKTNPVRLTLDHEDPLAVEGYTPKTDASAPPPPPTNFVSEDASDGEPMIFTSMEQLMEAAGTLPPEDANLKDAKVVEADLEFSVMSPDEYKQQMDEECKLDRELFEGHYNVFGSDEEDDSVTETPLEEDDEELIDADPLLDDEHVTEGRPGPAPRAFMVLWTTLSSWLTPEAADLLKDPSTPKTRSYTDVAASRCAGVMAMVNMHLPRARKELQIPEEQIKSVKLRVSDWLRCLDYSQQTHKLDTKMWRCLTVILIDVVESAQPAELPLVASDVGMTMEEYRYLTRSAIKSLQQGSAGG
jgi:hypothetical protein